MSYTQADVDALKSAAARGVLKTKIGDEEIQFASLGEMRRQVAVMENEIAGSGSMIVTYPRATRGL